MYNFIIIQQCSSNGATIIQFQRVSFNDWYFGFTWTSLHSLGKRNYSMNLSGFLSPCDKSLGQWRAKWDLLHRLNYWNGHRDKFMAQRSFTFSISFQDISNHQPPSWDPCVRLCKNADVKKYRTLPLLEKTLALLACWIIGTTWHWAILFLPHYQNHNHRSTACRYSHLHWCENTSAVDRLRSDNTPPTCTSVCTHACMKPQQGSSMCDTAEKKVKNTFLLSVCSCSQRRR